MHASLRAGLVVRRVAEAEHAGEVREHRLRHRHLDLRLLGQQLLAREAAKAVSVGRASEDMPIEPKREAEDEAEDEDEVV